MYRHDYNVLNRSLVSNSSRLYSANYYVMNSDFRVYICIDNGSAGISSSANAFWTNQHLLTLNQQRQAFLVTVIYGSICLQFLLLILLNSTLLNMLLFPMIGQLAFPMTSKSLEITETPTLTTTKLKLYRLMKRVKDIVSFLVQLRLTLLEMVLEQRLEF